MPNEFIAAVFGVMAAADQHTFQILTKRPERMRDFFAWYANEARDRELGPGLDPSSGLEDMPADLGFQEARGLGLELGEAHGIPWPLPNVWLGTSIENRRFVSRADALRETPAAVRFISAEPLLGPLLPMHPSTMAGPGWYAWPNGIGLKRERGLDLRGIDWLIVGGESGHGHRRMDLDWVRDLRDACLEQGLGHLRPDAGGRTAFFYKQQGGRTPKAGGRLLDGRTWSEFPEAAHVG